MCGGGGDSSLRKVVSSSMMIIVCDSEQPCTKHPWEKEINWKIITTQ